jgi:hypothetical protein
MADMSYQVFVALDATALEGGRIYLGEPNADPEMSPIPVFWDEARTIAADQPLLTSGGVIVRDGTPADVFAAESAYSIRVRDRSGSVVWYKPITGGGVSASRLTFPIPEGPPGIGIPGGNVESVGPPESLTDQEIPPGTKQVSTEDGRRWIEDPSMSDADVTAHGAFVKKAKFNRFFRLDIDNGVSVLAAGLDPAGVAACDDKFDALRAYMRRIVAPQTDNGPKCWALPPIEFPKGRYRFERTINLKEKVTLWSNGNGDPFGRCAILLFPAGVTGVIINRHNTINENDTAPVDSGTAACSTLRGLSFLYPGSIRTDVAEFVGSAIICRGRGFILDCEVDGSSWNGITLVANTEGEFYRGEASETQIIGGTISNNRHHGVELVGIDVNVAQVRGVRITQNGLYGINNLNAGPLDASNCHFASNGQRGAGKGIQSSSMVSNSGRHFGLRWDKDPAEAALAGNGPPTIGDNAYWYDLNRPDPNGNALGVAPQWVVGIPLHHGGAFLFKALTNWTVMYVEGTQIGGIFNRFNRASLELNIRFENTRVLSYQP